MTYVDVAVANQDLENRIRALQASIEQIIKGKPQVVELTVVALLARGHVLIEDVPGVGKTTLAHALARFWAKRALSERWGRA